MILYIFFRVSEREERNFFISFFSVRARGRNGNGIFSFIFFPFTGTSSGQFRNAKACLNCSGFPLGELFSPPLIAESSNRSNFYIHFEMRFNGYILLDVE